MKNLKDSSMKTNICVETFLTNRRFDGIVGILLAFTGGILSVFFVAAIAPSAVNRKYTSSE
jgi:hypothetical protein